jgi:hypothetical protein
LRLILGTDEMALVERGLQVKSQEEGRLVSLVEALVEYFGGVVSQARWGKVNVERALREAALERDGYTCQCPGCPNHLWLEMHHIVFYRDGGQTVPANLLILCGGCVTSVLCDAWEVAAA